MGARAKGERASSPPPGITSPLATFQLLLHLQLSTFFFFSVTLNWFSSNSQSSHCSSLTFLTTLWLICDVEDVLTSEQSRDQASQAIRSAIPSLNITPHHLTLGTTSNIQTPRTLYNTLSTRFSPAPPQSQHKRHHVVTHRHISPPFFARDRRHLLPTHPRPDYQPRSISLPSGHPRHE